VAYSPRSVHKTFTVNRPLVVDETIDGETILIHLGTGAYYSLDGVASSVWQLAAAGAPDGTILASLKDAYPEGAATIDADVGRLLAELAAEHLLIPQSESDSASRAPDALSFPPGYSIPVLHKYTDMQEFMLADPIHDVDPGVGWPHVKSL